MRENFRSCLCRDLRPDDWVRASRLRAAPQLPVKFFGFLTKRALLGSGIALRFTRDMKGIANPWLGGALVESTMPACLLLVSGATPPPRLVEEQGASVTIVGTALRYRCFKS